MLRYEVAGLQQYGADLATHRCRGRSAGCSNCCRRAEGDLCAGWDRSCPSQHEVVSVTGLPASKVIHDEAVPPR